MMTIAYPERHFEEKKFFDPSSNEFVVFPAMTLKPMKLQLEHSLISIRNWEAEFHKAFTELDKMTPEELLGYIKCMTINTQKDDTAYEQLNAEDIQRVAQYISKSNSAWEIRQRKDDQKKSKKAKQNTVESVYFAMIQFGIPFEPCEKWHIGSLIALIDYCSEHSPTVEGGGGSKKQPVNMRELRESWMRINEANRKKYKSRG